MTISSRKAGSKRAAREGRLFPIVFRSRLLWTRLGALALILCPPDFPFRAAPKAQIIYQESSFVTFDDGVPDYRLLQTSALANAYRTALQRATRVGGMTYGDPMGSSDLRQLIAEMLSTHRGMVATPENICITRGVKWQSFLRAESYCLLETPC